MYQIPQADLEILKAYTIGRPKEFLFTYPEYKLSILQNIRLRYFVWLYKRGYSVAAIIKHKEFFGLDFFVNRHVLIPRPETELMVENALEEIKKIGQDVTLIDIGTGSGCVPIAILKNINRQINAFATDISRKALKAAKKNAKKQNVKISFLHDNLLEPILKNRASICTFPLIITANLPYLTEEQFQKEHSIQKEPKTALVADNGGLALYEELFQQIHLLPILPITIFMEIDPSQITKASDLINNYYPNANIQIKNDLAGRDRLIVLRIEPIL